MPIEHETTAMRPVVDGYLAGWVGGARGLGWLTVSLTSTSWPVLTAVFNEDSCARAAVQTLNDIGFAGRDLGYVARHGEMLEAVGALRAVDVPEHDLLGGLIRVGVPLAAARELVAQFERGRTIVTVQPAGKPHLVERELRRAGAESVATWQTHVPPLRD